MDSLPQQQRRGPFTRRRTFTIGPSALRPPAPAAPPRHDASQGQRRDLKEHQPPHHYQRTVSAPTFTRRAVEPLSGFPSAKLQVSPTAGGHVHADCSEHAAAARVSAGEASPCRCLPLRSRSQDTRVSSEASERRCRASDAITGASSAVAGASLQSARDYVAGSHSVSPDPRKPSVAPSFDASPVRPPFANDLQPRPVYEDDGSTSVRHNERDERAAVAVSSASSVWRPPTAELLLPSIASSIHSGGLGVIDDASTFSPKWYSAWATSRHEAPLDTTLAPSSVKDTNNITRHPRDAAGSSKNNIGSTGAARELAMPSLSDPSAHDQNSVLSPFTTPEGKPWKAAEVHLATFGQVSALDHTPMSRRNYTAGGALVGDVSSIFPDTLGQTMPPDKSKTLNRTANSSVAAAKSFAAQVRVRVDSCAGLPSTPFCVEKRSSDKKSEKSDGADGSANIRKGSATTSTPANENLVYVYMRSNRASKRYKSATVPYATAITFPSHQSSFVVPCTTVKSDKLHTNKDNNEEEDKEEVLTFTAAVKLASGKQVKLGIAELALSNLPESQPVPISMPIVAKAGTRRAHERGTLVLTITAENCGVAGALLPPLEEAFVRERVTSVLRRVCRGQLHRVEVHVRRHCNDTLAELQRFVVKLETDCLLAKTTTVAGHTISKSHATVNKEAGAEKELHKRTAAVSVAPDSSSSSRSSSSTPSLSFAKNRNRESSSFTSCVVEPHEMLRRSFSYTATPKAEKNEQARWTSSANTDRSLAQPHKKKQPVSGPLRSDEGRAAPALSVRKLREANAAYQRCRSAPHAPGQKVAAAAPPSFSAAPTSSRVTTPLSSKKLHTRVKVQSVSALRDEEGLPIFNCADCFVHICALGGGCVQSDALCVASSTAAAAGVTTESADYKDHRAIFLNSSVDVLATNEAANPLLKCTVYHGTPSMRQEIGLCEVSLKQQLAAGAAGSGKEFLLVRHAGTPQAHICGVLRLLFSLVTQSNHAALPTPAAEAVNDQGDCKTPKDARSYRDVLQQRVLSYLWHHCRAELHRLDAIVEDAAVLGFDRALSTYSSATPAETRQAPVLYLNAANSVRMALQTASLTGETAIHEAWRLPPASATHNILACAPRVTTPTQGLCAVYVAWSCGCYGGRTQALRVTATDTLLRFHEAIPTMTDVDPSRDELCLVLYGVPADAVGGEAQEMCRSHVSMRSFRVCMQGKPATVQLPLVWYAGERGAVAQGVLTLDVEITEPPFTTHPVKNCPGLTFRREAWEGFHFDWAPRIAVAQLLSCYATDQLHRLLPLLADAEGREEVLLKRLKATYGAADAPVQLRVCLVQFRCFDPSYRKCYLKLYRGEESLLRTPTIPCGPAQTVVEVRGGGEDRSAMHSRGAVPLLDEDKYLCHLSTSAPHHETLLLKMGVEHLVKKNDIVAYAELSVAAFVSLESRLEESMHRTPSTSRSPSSGHRGSGASSMLRAPLWIPLRNDADVTVAQVAVRVEWVHATTLAPVRRVTTQKKSAVSAVLRTSGTSSGRGVVSGEAIPLLDVPTTRDLFSLLNTYYPSELYRWSWYLARWADATKAHRQLRRALLPPRLGATVFVDLAGLSVRTAARGTRLGALLASTHQQLTVTATCLGSSSSCATCRVLPCEAARATVEASTVLASIDSPAATGALSGEETLRLDLPLPTSTSTEEDLCLIFALRHTVPDTSAPASSARGLHRRALSAPKRRHRSHSAEHFHQLRSRSTVAPPQALSNGSAVSPRRSRSAFTRVEPTAAATRKSAEVGRVYVSLRALVTIPELYREGEMVTVPLVAQNTQPEESKASVLGDVYLRVRTPTHERVPDWLRYTRDQISRMSSRSSSNGSHTREEVRARLQQQQLRLEFAATASHTTKLAEVHAAFFRELAAAAPPQDVARQADKTSDGSGAAHPVTPPPPPSLSAHKTARPPLVPRKQPAASPGEAADGAFTVHDVFSRVGSRKDLASELDDFTTPQRGKTDRSVHEWTSEKGGATVDRSTGTGHSSLSVQTEAPSHESHLTTKRALIF